jgi:hypothetical protein
VAGGQFIPDIYGFHSTDNRQALYVTGAIGELNDSGYEPVMVFDARRENGVVTTRNLFAWDSYNSRKMVLSAGGNLGIGVSNPGEKLSLNGGILIPVASATDNDSPALVAVSNDDYLYDGQYINHYGFGFHNFNDGSYNGVNAYISSFYGVDVFTGGVARLRVSSTGNVGIGTTTAQSRLHVADGNGGEQLRFSRGTGTVRFAQDTDQDNLYLFNSDASQTYMFWNSNGYVGIGTHQPDAKLTVKGDIHAQEVKVDLTGAVAPDYVFEQGYDLMPLDKLATYVATNKHLPETPSAAEMERDGLSLKEMNLLLLRKVEELTLHLIAQNRVVAEQSEKLRLLEDDIRKVKRERNTDKQVRTFEKENGRGRKQ